METTNIKKKHSIKDKDIDHVKTFKYLGLVIAKNGTTDKEINKRIENISRLFNTKNTFFKKGKFLDK